MKPLAEVLAGNHYIPHCFDETGAPCGEHLGISRPAASHLAAVVAEWLESAEVRDFVRIRLTYMDSAVGPALAALAAHAKGEAS